MKGNPDQSWFIAPALLFAAIGDGTLGEGGLGAGKVYRPQALPLCEEDALGR